MNERKKTMECADPSERPGMPIRILLVEDNKSDIHLTIETLKKCKVTNTVDVVRDGEEAMAFLRRADGYRAALRPDLILLDLNLPKKDGRDVLSEIKQDPDLRRIIVVVLTSSAAERDIVKTYDLHANAYVVKPMDLYQFAEVMKSIKEFWMTFVKYPPK